MGEEQGEAAGVRSSDKEEESGLSFRSPLGVECAGPGEEGLSSGINLQV